MIHKLLLRTIELLLRFVCGCIVVALPMSLHAAPWLPFGPDGGDARRFATDPTDHTHLFLGTANGWIYETHNFGASWHRLAQVGHRDDLVLDSIVVDPTNPMHLLVGAWVLGSNDGGMFISSDGGVTWINQAEMRGQSVRSLAISLSDPKILVAGSLQGIFRTSDAGQHWQRISPPDSLEIHEVESVAIDPLDASVIYAGTWHLPWKTTDGGAHWENIKDGIIDDSDVFSIIVDPVAPKVVYASACSGIYKSEDAGLLFHKVQGIPSTSRRTRVLLQDPANRAVVFAGTTEGLYRSGDAGKLWTAKTGKDVIVNDVAVDGKDSRRVLIATDRGGVLESEDGGDTFKPSNGGFSTRQITAMRRDAMHPATIYVGVVNDKEWGGVFRSDNGGLNWKQESTGLGGRDVFSLGQAPDGSMIAGTAHGLFRMESTGEEWKPIEGPAPANAPAIAGDRPAATSTRPPVPVGRNHFAERKNEAPRASAKSTPAKAALKGKTPARAATRKAQLPAARKHGPADTRPGAVTRARAPTHSASHGTTRLGPVALAHAAPQNRVSVSGSNGTPPLHAAQAAVPSTAAHQQRFDGSVYVLATSGNVLLAATSAGLLSSADDGVTWVSGGPQNSADWRFMAAAKQNVVAASLDSLQFSSDAGASWVPIPMPENLTRIAAVAVEPSGTIWVGGREGVFVSANGGSEWTTPKNLYVNAISSLYYDDATDRITLTSGTNSSYKGYVFTVQLPQRTITYTDAGWTLRFARPVGDHLVGATLFDGMVVQPKMIAAPVAAAGSAAR